MKKFYLLILLLFGCLVLGQIDITGNAQYKLSLNGYVGGAGSESCGTFRGLQWITLFYENGSLKNIYGTYGIRKDNFTNRAFNYGNIYYTKNDKITRLNIRTTNRKGNANCTSYENEGNLAITTCMNRYYDFEEFESRDDRSRSVPGYVVVKSEIDVKLNFDPLVPYILGSTDNLKISLPDNLYTTDYNWKYRIGSDPIQSFPSVYNNKPVLNIPASEFISESNFGKVVTVWLESNCVIDGVTSKSNIFTFTTLLTAPKIINAESQNTTCSYNNDGKVILKFDRLLRDGESLKAALVDVATNSTIENYTLADLATTKEITIDNLPAGKYRLELSDGRFNGHNTYTDSPQHIFTFTINKPDPVEFYLTSKTDVFCFAGSDGRIRLNAKGGQNKFQYSLDMGQTWIDFNNGNEAELQQLVVGNYKIMVRDSNACFALDEQGANKVLTVSITQPEKAIALTSTIQTPTGYGLTNGYIVADISGGTPNDDGSYSYEWKKDSPSGEVLTDEPPTINTTPKSYTLKLNNIGAGKYYLTVKDKNYANATSSLSNCGIILQEFEVTQPDPLKVDIQVAKAISCNIANVYSNIGGYDDNQNGIPDFAEDGQLSAVVTGGVIDYKYQWQKEVGGSFQDVVGETLSTLKSLIAGHYKVKIVDKNGNATEADYTLQYPEELKLSLFANSIKCNSQNEGEVMATVTGGSGAYTYAWNTGDNVAHITGLNAGFYYVSVRDGNNCPVDANIEIKQPSQLLIEEVSVAQPTCDGQSNGAIEVKVSGGELPYKVEWSNGMTGESISGLSAGTYTVKFTDKNGCFATKDFVLTNPVPLIIDLGKDITLCSGDSKTYDTKIKDPNATYVWRDQNAQIISTISTVTLTKAGTYTVTVTNSNGCSGTDDIVVKNSTEVLQPNFLVATYAFTDRIIEVINTSYIKPEKMDWVIPAGAEVVSKTEALLQIKFKDKGSYKVGLQASQGACEKLIEKEVIVETNDYAVQDPSSNASNIKSFVITPNPNSGAYKVLIELNVERSVRIRVMDMQSREVSKPFDAPKGTKFDLPFNLALTGASYLVILETGNQVMVKKMIVK